MDILNIVVIEGTDRPGRRSFAAAKLIAELGSEIEGLHVTLVDPKDYDFEYGSGDPKYTDLVDKADAFFIVTPEYNHSFSGTLKTLLDMELKKYIHKPVALAGVSTSPWGGVRAIEALVPVVRELGMTVTFTDVNFPKVNETFDENGNLLDDSMVERIKTAYTELIWMAKTLKWGREHLPSKYHSDA